MKARTGIIMALFLGLYGTLGFNMYRLQIKNGEFYLKRVEARNELVKELTLHRGAIFITDKNNNKIPIAVNKEYPVIYAVPKEIKESAKTAHLIAPIIEWKEDDAHQALNHPEALFRLLVDKPSEAMLEKIRAAHMSGVYVGAKERRFYPSGSYFGNTLGFVGLNKDVTEPTGLYGIERYYDEMLTAGKDLYLTVDRNIQAEAEETIKSLREKFKAESGVVIVQEPDTGKILALAHAPDFDPNFYSEFPVGAFKNSAVQDMYEPGSVFKPITMAAGIDLKVITPETSYYDKGSVTLNGKIVKNWDEKANGTITMTNVIEKSVNTGAVFAVQKIGRQNFYEYLKKFGFGDLTEISLPDETPASLLNLERDRPYEIDLATASFGQGIAVTPIQIISAFSSLANRGVLMRPSLKADEKSRVVRRVISEDTAEKVTAMMESAVEKARVAALPQYRIAGKTGTAQIPDLQNGGYTDAFSHTFIGFGPVADPRFTALIKLEKPNVTLAGQTVVPAFHDLAQYILGYYNVPPDKNVQ